MPTTTETAGLSKLAGQFLAELDEARIRYRTHNKKGFVSKTPLPEPLKARLTPTLWGELSEYCALLPQCCHCNGAIYGPTATVIDLEEMPVPISRHYHPDCRPSVQKPLKSASVLTDGSTVDYLGRCLCIYCCRRPAVYPESADLPTVCRECSAVRDQVNTRERDEVAA